MALTLQFISTLSSQLASIATVVPQIKNQLQPFQSASTLPSLGYSIWNPWNGGWRQMDSMEFPDHSMDFPDGFHTV